jgi:hypothetical protein
MKPALFSAHPGDALDLLAAHDPEETLDQASSK